MSAARLISLSVIAVAMVSVACNSSEEPGPDPEPSVALGGIFRARTGGGPGIDEIELYDDSSYRALANGCQAAECEEYGRFTVNRGAYEMVLVPDGGTSYSLPFEILAKKKPAARLTPADLTNGQSELTTSGGALVATEIKLVDREYSLFDEQTDRCLPKGTQSKGVVAWLLELYSGEASVLPPTLVENEFCGGPSKTNGFAHCYQKNGECSSSQRSCLSDAAAKRWDERADECSKLDGKMVESQGRGGYVATACCKK